MPMSSGVPVESSSHAPSIVGFDLETAREVVAQPCDCRVVPAVSVETDGADWRGEASQSVGILLVLQRR